MKKKIFALLLSAVTGLAVLTTGCTMLDLTEEPKVMPEVEEPEEDEEKHGENEEDEIEAEIVELSVAEQLAVIDNDKNTWEPAFTEGYTDYVAVTDLDADGRLEVITVKCVMAAASDASFRIFEVNNAGTGVEELEIDWKYSESMPDLVMMGMAKCAIGSGSDNVEGYVITDSCMFGYSRSIDRKFVMSVKDNVVSIEKVGSADNNMADGGITTIYYGRSENVTSEEAYESAEDTYLNATLSGNYNYAYQSWDFICVIGDVTLRELEASYDGFIRYSSLDEYYGTDSSATTDLYPEGWVPTNYAGETRYSALGNISMENTSQGILREAMWQAVEMHDSDGIYVYDYRDEIDRLDSCLMTFGYDGTGYYSDGYGNTLSFSYELYSTELFTNVSISFDDGTYAFAFSYELNIEGEDFSRTCLIVSFENEELYFIQSAD